MWLPDTNPDIDDDLMTDWLDAVTRASRQRGLTGPVLKATMIELVDHLSGGVREVVLRKTSKEDG